LADGAVRGVGGPRLLRPPRLRTLEDGDVRHASYLELFFDLVFVVAIAQLAHELVVDHGPVIVDGEVVKSEGALVGEHVDRALRDVVASNEV
jgi:hypothetical protein